MAAKDEGGDLKEALSKAADVPLAMAEAGTEVASIAVRLAKDGNPSLKGDATAAVLLAEAGVRVAAKLVKINLSGAGITDKRLDRLLELFRRATTARQILEVDE